MPIYEFTCYDCDKDSELLVRSSSWEGEAHCSHCGSPKLEKKLSVFAAAAADNSTGSAEMPPCSGMPSNCGRCSLEN